MYYIYFICANSRDSFIKIGRAKTPRYRIKAFQRWSPYKLHILATLREEHTTVTERDLHKRFRAHRVHGEWFRPHPELLDYIITLPDYSPAPIE